MFDLITVGSATRDVFLMSQAMHPHRAKDALTHIEACFPFGAKINVDNLHFDTGGGATNNAVTFARLGKFKTAALCRVGSDSAGQDIRAALKRDRVDTALVQTARSEHTAYSTIISPGGEVGERTILVYRGASHHLDHAKIPWTKLRARWFYISSLDGDLVLLKKILAHAKKVGAHVAWNPGGEEIKNAKLKMQNVLQGVSFLIINREEATKLTGKNFNNTKALLCAIAHNSANAIMTDGPQGAYAVFENKAYSVPSVGHPPKNLTGAGDAFGAGFLTGWIKSRGNIATALRLGAFNADSVVQHVGAKRGILQNYPTSRKLKNLTVRTLDI